MLCYPWILQYVSFSNDSGDFNTFCLGRSRFSIDVRSQQDMLLRFRGPLFSSPLPADQLCQKSRAELGVSFFELSVRFYRVCN